MALSLVGGFLLLIQPLPELAKLPLATAWLAVNAWELWRLWRAWAPVSAYRLFPDGTVEIELDEGALAARFRAGSLCLPSAVWLRVRAEDGRSWGELLAGNSRKNKEWRRLQAICRQVSAC